MEAPELLNQLKHLPKWVWVAVAGAVVLVIILANRNRGAGQILPAPPPDQGKDKPPAPAPAPAPAPDMSPIKNGLSDLAAALKASFTGLQADNRRMWDLMQTSIHDMQTGMHNLQDMVQHPATTPSTTPGYSDHVPAPDGGSWPATPSAPPATPPPAAPPSPPSTTPPGWSFGEKEGKHLPPPPPSPPPGSTGPI